MLDIFRIGYETKGMYTMIPQWQFVKDGLRRNRETARNFYQQEIYQARSDHVLMTLIYTLNIARNSTAARVYDNALARSNSLAQQMKFTSALGKGQVFRNMFFGGNSKEIIFGTSSLTSPDAIVSNWRNMKPVRILRHPFTDTNGNIPDQRLIVKDGLSFFSVDIPMIAVMYWCFQKEQDMVEAGGQPRHTPAQFVYAYLLANMVEDMIDHALFNRIYCLATGTPRNDHPKTHPYAYPTFSTDVDAVMRVMWERVQETRRRLTGQLDQVKLVFAEDALELSALPSIAPTLQCYWALAACRLRMLEFGFLSMNNPRTNDATDINLIQWAMNLQKTPQVIRNNLPIDAYVHVASELEYIMGL